MYETTAAARLPEADLLCRSDVVARRYDVGTAGRPAEVASTVEQEPAAGVAATFGRPRAGSWSPVAATGQPAAVEQYRRAAGSLIQAQAVHGVKVVMVASAVQGEGKSLTAANLALTLARSYRRNTLLVDADLRLPTLHEIFRLDNARGLRDHLESRGDEPADTVEVQPLLTFLPAGQPTSDPVGGLTSARMQRFVGRAAAAFDWVVLDTPPVTLLPDANLLAAMADAVILVIAAGRTQHEFLTRAVEALGRERILGVVLNRVSAETTKRYGYGTY